MWGKEKEG
jgi:hypothetical protein